MASLSKRKPRLSNLITNVHFARNVQEFPRAAFYSKPEGIPINIYKYLVFTYFFLNLAQVHEEEA